MPTPEVLLGELGRLRPSLVAELGCGDAPLLPHLATCCPPPAMSGSTWTKRPCAAPPASFAPPPAPAGLAAVRRPAPPARGSGPAGGRHRQGGAASPPRPRAGRHPQRRRTSAHPWRPPPHPRRHPAQPGPRPPDEPGACRRRSPSPSRIRVLTPANCEPSSPQLASRLWPCALRAWRPSLLVARKKVQAHAPH
jgi:hypothetical protein